MLDIIFGVLLRKGSVIGNVSQQVASRAILQHQIEELVLPMRVS